jgi:hypothetical protein
MTAVVAETSEAGDRARPFYLWEELAGTVDRAGGDAARLWVDDSKAILRGGKGRDRLEAACLAAIHAAGLGLPGSLRQLLEDLGAGRSDEAELTPWCDEGDSADSWPWIWERGRVEELLARRPLDPASGGWRLAAVHSVVVGPGRFNRELAATDSKAAVHFSAFAGLLRPLWERAADGVPTAVTGDKHGGRHYYLELLLRVFEDAWVDRGPEGAALSRYAIRDSVRRLELNLVPKADGQHGLVALASIVSKTVRELWMDGFNAYWQARVPGLRPTAGYPVDARRFRLAIEESASAAGLHPRDWWRER